MVDSGDWWILLFFCGIIRAFVRIAFLVVWIVATVKAFTGVRWEIPYIGPVARQAKKAEQFDRRATVGRTVAGRLTVNRLTFLSIIS